MSVAQCLKYLLPGTSPVSHKTLIDSKSAANNNIHVDDGRHVLCDLMEIYREYKLQFVDVCVYVCVYACVCVCERARLAV